MTDEMTTNARADRFYAAFKAWIAECGDQGDMATNLSDMMADAKHFVDANGLDWLELDERSGRYYREERAELGKASITYYEIP